MTTEKKSVKPAAEETKKTAAKTTRTRKTKAVQETLPIEAPATAKTVKKTTRKKRSRKTVKTAASPRKEKLFALDIGTRSVIGIAAERTISTGEIKIIATRREEHKTRAMLDGQIHDVPQVAAVIKSVKKALTAEVGPLQHAAVAAAGRALYTMTAEAELEINGIITAEQERRLDFAGVQAAQAKLASSHTIDDPTRYYCVGYSTIKYTLDGNQLKTLVGQRGQKAQATVIATFLPRQVIDSIQSALHEAKLDMRALTLEPIAAINVLIPPTMRHLNLVLVDIGAGTSDVAITKNGSVIAYGMVPQAGDEITEAISQKYLLDFNIAEEIKRNAANGINSSITDILGTKYDLKPEDVIEPIMPNIKTLAEAIAKQIIDLNNEAPQAVLLVGGGALTPHLPELVAESLGLPLNRVAVRQPTEVDKVENIPEELHSPDAVTPLGILKIASLNTLHFLSVYVNEEEYSLFNFRDLTVSDALLSAGINLKKFNGHPGLGLMLTINDERKFIPGTMGTLAKLTLDGEPATINTPIKSDAHITIQPGKDGTVPEVTVQDILSIPKGFHLYINDEETYLPALVTVNGKNAAPDQKLGDSDIIETRETRSVGEALLAAGFPPTGARLSFMLNGSPSHYNGQAKILLNDEPAVLSMEVHEGDRIEYIEPPLPKLGEVLNLSELETNLVIYFNKEEHTIPASSIELTVNGHSATPGTLVDEGSIITYTKSERTATTVSDALLACNYQPPSATSRMKFTILLNNQPAEFTDPIKNGDSLDVVLESPEDKNAAPQEKAAQPDGLESLLPPNYRPPMPTQVKKEAPYIPGMPVKTETVPPATEEAKPAPTQQPAEESSETMSFSIADFIHH